MSSISNLGKQTAQVNNNQTYKQAGLGKIIGHAGDKILRHGAKGIKDLFMKGWKPSKFDPLTGALTEAGGGFSRRAATVGASAVGAGAANEALGTVGLNLPFTGQDRWNPEAHKGKMGVEPGLLNSLKHWIGSPIQSTMAATGVTGPVTDQNQVLKNNRPRWFQQAPKRKMTNYDPKTNRATYEYMGGGETTPNSYYSSLREMAERVGAGANQLDVAGDGPKKKRPKLFYDPKDLPRYDSFSI